MSEILVAVDGSKHSAKVVDVARQIAKSLSAGVILVYVVHSSASGETADMIAFERAENFPDAYANYLQDLSEEVTDKMSIPFREAGIPVRSITPEGHPAEQILNVAEKEHPAMIVMGVKGYTESQDSAISVVL